MGEGIGCAPGKAILLGEHAVVYNHPAIAIPVRGVEAQALARTVSSPGISLDCPDLNLFLAPDQAAPSAVKPFLDLARRMLQQSGCHGVGLHVRLRSTIPVQRGMGSGAAMSVALVRAIAGALQLRVSEEEVIALAYEAERFFHHDPSGIDNHVVARNQAIYYTRRRGCQPIRCRESEFHFLVADCGVRPPTAEVVRQVAEARCRQPAHYDALFWEIGHLVSYARQILAHGSPAQLGMCLNRNHELLCELGVSSETIDRLVAAACKAGAAGAKLSGAGRGGSVIALLSSAEQAAEVRAALQEAGAQAIYEAAIRN